MAEVVTRGIRLDPTSVRSIYLGGGTPSKLGGGGIQALFSRLGDQLGVGPLSGLMWKSVEVTIEANPEDVTEEAARAWRAAGVNRVSLGVQSFDPRVLEWMHRGHGPDAAGAAVRQLRAAGILDISLDLIFAVPEALGRDWGRDLDGALALDPTHISLYGLTVEPRTPLGRWAARGEAAEAPEERYAEEFLEAHRRLGAAGFDHYEVSNYARPGHRARHNSAYWSGVPYLGVGPAAHGFDGEHRRWNREAYADWCATLLDDGRDPIEGSEQIGEAEGIAEAVYLGLRTSDGLNIRQNERKTVTQWIDARWAEPVEADGATERVRLTPDGWLRLDAIAATLTALRSRS